MNKILPTISFDDFEEHIQALVDLTTVPPSTIIDYTKRNDNIVDNVLCPECDGTGNLFFSSYKACKKCGGSGRFVYLSTMW